MTAKAAASPKHSLDMWVIVSAFAAIGCFALVMLGVFIAGNMRLESSSSVSSVANRYANTANAAVLPNERPPEANPTTDDVFTSSLGINAGQFWRIPFTVANPQGGRLVGSFTADGGGNDDIECFVINESEYLNFKNNNQYRVFYESGRVTTSEIDLRLRPGRYFLIFSNRWAVFTAKTVAGNIILEQ